VTGHASHLKNPTDSEQEMSEKLDLEALGYAEHGKLKAGIPGRVQRVVPGKLLYVDAGPTHEPYVFTLDKIIVNEGGGAFHPYRGEPLFELGLTEGRKVSVIGLNDPKTHPMLVIDSSSSKIANTAANFGHSLTHFSIKTMDLFRQK
jgi:hypothetical protein